MKFAIQVESTITSRRLIAERESLLVAVSGGVDSMVLLHLLKEMAPRHGWRLAVAHLNHRLRGRSSEADEALVRKTARRLKLRCIVSREDVRQLARQKKKSLEMAAREARHKFLAATARRVRASKVVLAHHADDQVELFFLRLFRGSGSEGLAGMKWNNPSPEDPKVVLIRPLLDIPKGTLAEYARTHQVAFREDATNAHLDIPRNRVRLELLPFLKKNFQPRLHKVVSRAMEILGADSDYVTEAARCWLARETEPNFGELATAVQRRVLQLQLLERGVVPEFEQLEALRLNPGVAVELAGAAGSRGDRGGKRPMRLLVDAHGRLRVAPLVATRFSRASIEVALPRSRVLSRKKAQKTQKREACSVSGKGAARFEGITISWKICEGAPKIRPKPLPGREMFDAEAVGDKVILRHWRAGDRFQPIGMKNPVKLQDYFVNAKVPREQRHRLVIATSAFGEVFWVEGLRISERFKLTPRTTRGLQWVWERL